VATPMYGGMCCGMFCKASADLAALCANYQLPMQYYFLFNESLITRARNYCCLPFNSILETEDGKQTIQNIVENQYRGKILSFNRDSGKTEWKYVLNHWKRENKERKKWVRLKGTNKKREVICTDDHECLSLENPLFPSFKYFPAKEMGGKYAIKQITTHTKTRNNNPLYNQHQLSVLLGTVLGDGHLTKKFGYLQINHSEKQYDYITHLHEVFGGSLSKTSCLKKPEGGFLKEEYLGYKLCAPINAQTKYLRELIYDKDNKKTVKNILSYLDEISLAYWYMDDGYFLSGKSNGSKPTAGLCTHSFDEEDHLLMKEWFAKEWDIDVSIKKDTKYCHLHFSHEASLKFWKLISPYIISSMRYKLPEDMRTNYDIKYLNTECLGFSAEYIQSVDYDFSNKNKIEHSHLYDIEVEDNHNFIANNLVLKNCDEFMRSPAEHLMFIDSDIGYTPQDIIALMALQTLHADYDIIGGPYPKKCISWEKIKQAVDKGMADENPSNLEKFVGDYVFNPRYGQSCIPLGEPVEVLEIGTGFMMIKKDAMKKFYNAYPQYMYKPDHARTEHFDGSREIMQFFQAEIEPMSKRYLSEDYWFCQKAQAIGLKTWICPWMKTQHVGSYIFGGSLSDLASIGASATVDPEKLKIKRQAQEGILPGPSSPVQLSTPIKPKVKKRNAG
jgi:hypothetical protein